MTETNQQQQKIHWRPFVISQNETRIFNCNAIRFVNAGDQSNVMINDIYPLIWNISGAMESNALELRSQLNEIDVSVYKFTFVPTNPIHIHKLIIWIKEVPNGGYTKEQIKAIEDGTPPDRRKQSEVNNNKFNLRNAGKRLLGRKWF